MLARDVREGVEDVLRGERQRQPGRRVARRDPRLDHTNTQHTITHTLLLSLLGLHV